ncbi:MAG: hydantoinase/oxoprolinase family protein, partial [Chloroflexi bacterium]|nr:hydantoinase/oxoprolinase family protein [Chloroflexota bacterium]
RNALDREGVPASDMTFERHADVRYVGQSYELSVSLPPGRLGRLDAAALADLSDAFHVEHERAYGHKALEEPVELVNLRVTALGDIARPSLREVGAGSGAGGAVKETRKVYFAESGGLIDCRVYDRYRLGEGDSIAGPAIVEEVDSTTVIHPGTSASVDRFGNLLIS